jgi:hypothetical protein
MDTPGKPGYDEWERHLASTGNVRVLHSRTTRWMIHIHFVMPVLDTGIHA